MRSFKNVAFIPVRGGSKSIPLKNIRLINDRPLVYWVLDAAEKSEYIEHIFVSTDSDIIKDVVQNYRGSKTTVIGRSPETARDTSTTESALLEFAHNYDFEKVVLIQATSPLLRAEDIDEGFRLLYEKGYDSIFSVVRQKRFIWEENSEGLLNPVNYNPFNRPRRQEFEGFLVENGAFYITSIELLLKNKCRISGRIGKVEMPEETHYELDEPHDWVIVENLLKLQKTLPFKNLVEIAAKIKLFVTDCDGVLTDGGMYYSEQGDELKKFNNKDGMGIALLKKHGIKTALITGEKVKLVERRAKKMGIDYVYLGIKNKLKTLRLLANNLDINLEEVLYIGDDINDLEAIKAVGLGCCVADGMETVKNVSKLVTKAKGGEGAVREVAELLIMSKLKAGNNL